MKIFAFVLLFIFPFNTNQPGDQDLWKELSSLEKQHHWQIVVGGNRIYKISIANKSKQLLLANSPWYHADWGSVALSPDGEYLAASKFTKDHNEIVLIKWKRYLEGQGKIENYITEPLKDYESTSSFSWSPNGKKLVFQGKNKIPNLPDWKNKNPEKLYLYDLVSSTIDELPINRVYSISPHAWSESNKLVYEPSENFISLYDFDTSKVQDLFEGYFPTWRADGMLTYLELNPTRKDTYYLYDIDNKEKNLLMKGEIKRGENGSVFSPIVWSPDSKYFLFGRQTGLIGSNDDLYIREASSGKEVKICDEVDMLNVGKASWIAGPEDTTSEKN